MLIDKVLTRSYCFLQSLRGLSVTPITDSVFQNAGTNPGTFNTQGREFLLLLKQVETHIMGENFLLQLVDFSTQTLRAGFQVHTSCLGDFPRFAKRCRCVQLTCRCFAFHPGIAESLSCQSWSRDLCCLAVAQSGEARLFIDQGRFLVRQELFQDRLFHLGTQLKGILGSACLEQLNGLADPFQFFGSICRRF